MIQNEHNSYAALFLPLILAACGGATGPGPLTPDPTVDPTADPILPYIEYSLLDEDLQSQHQNLAYTTDADLPGTGTAQYHGVMRLITELHSRQAQIAGAMTMNVDFGASSLTGTASGFRDDRDNAFSGQLFITNGVLDRDADPDWEYRYFADIDGTLQGDGTDLRINADLYGDFHGPEGQSIAGGLAGRPSGAAVGDYLYGTFAAQK